MKVAALRRCVSLSGAGTIHLLRGPITDGWAPSNSSVCGASFATDIRGACQSQLELHQPRTSRRAWPEARLRKETKLLKAFQPATSSRAGPPRASAAVLSGPGRASAQGIAWDHEADVVVAVHRAVPPSGRAASGPPCSWCSNFDVGGKMITAAASSPWAAGMPTRIARAPTDGFGLSTCSAGRSGGRPRPLVQGHDRLVGHGCNAIGAIPIQRSPPAPSGPGPTTLHDQAIPARRELRPVYPCRRHPFWRRRGSARIACRKPTATDIQASRLSAEDRGDRGRAGTRASIRCAKRRSSASIGPRRGWATAASAWRRYLEFSARASRMLNRHMDEIIPRGPVHRQVLRSRRATPRFEPGTGARLESFTNGNTDERAATISAPQGGHHRHRHER